MVDDLVERLRNGVVCDCSVCRTGCEAADRIEELERAAAAIPAPRYKDGDTFVGAKDNKLWAVIVGKPTWDGKKYLYRYRDSTVVPGPVSEDWPIEQAVDLGRYVQVPRRTPDDPA